MGTVPPNVFYFHTDLGSSDAIKESAAQIKSKVGNPTVLVNNAGFARGKTILDTTDNDLRLTFQVNAISHYQLAQQFLPHMITNNHGMIVTVASLASYVTAPALVDYCASKSAALTFHEGLQAELATLYRADKVRCVAICQGYTRTALFAGFNEGDGFFGYALDPETVAEEVVRAVLAGKSDHIILPRGNAQITNLKGWPTWAQVGLRKDMKKMMKEWKGRQVLQPSELQEKEGKLDESIVEVKSGA
jgi:short-subunit dehydrogenase